MQYGNWYLAEQVQRMRYDDMRREADRAHFMKRHELDLWSVVRRALRRGSEPVHDVRLPRREAPRVRIVPAR